MPNEFPLLTDLLVLLLASVPIAFICQRLRLPVMVGFMVTGVIAREVSVAAESRVSRETSSIYNRGASA